MMQLLKRLEIIKSALAIQDEEIIGLQIARLEKLESDEDILDIVALLKRGDYAQALEGIERYFSRYRSIALHVDKELQSLKLELKYLENKVQILIEQKRDYLNKIDEFNKEYNLRLGELIKDILNFKKEILYKKTIKKQKAKELHAANAKTIKETKETVDELAKTIIELEEALEDIDKSDENYDEIYTAYTQLKKELEQLEEELANQEEVLKNIEKEIGEDEAFQAYKDAQSDYEKFENDYERIKQCEENRLQLSAEENAKLKKLYKKAARLCHPDIVPDKLKEKAHMLIQALNSAYNKKDLAEVARILVLIESGSGFIAASDAIDDKELLRAKIEEHKQSIAQLKKEIKEIKNDEIYLTIEALESWDEYFKELEDDLKKEKERLEKEAKTILQENLNVHQEANQDEDEEEVFEHKELIIELTSAKYLNSYEEKAMREDLFYGYLVNPKLYIQHEPNNSYDSLAIKVFCNDIFIGYVLKYKDKENIENFCFQNRKLKQLHIVFEGGMLKLVSKRAIMEEKTAIR